jgi:predicted hydrocarbon binding protein
MALGFLEAAVSHAEGATALGTELHCQSQSAGPCVFVVKARSRPAA